MDPRDSYEDPLVERYASRAMVENFSTRRRYRLWRELWIALAEAEAELGLPIRPEQIEEMQRHAGDIDFDRVAAIESELRHDVMAHIAAFGERCPLAKPIIHLGATSCFVTDNADLVILRRGLEIVRDELSALLAALRDFALRHRGLPTLAYTHLQPASPTTVGKRAALWAQDFLADLEEVCDRIEKLRFLGAKGATGTQASFLRLFRGDGSKVEALDRKVAEKMGFSSVLGVAGQTYPRKVDARILQALSGIAQSAHKFSTDLRILQGFGEIEEPFEEKQVGSSAMPYKRNPMRLERISSLAKFAICECMNPVWIHATQWFERTLDDSADRRVSLPHAFLAADAILVLSVNVVRGLRVYPEAIGRRVAEELPFLVAEDILMLGVEAGGDRQDLHERLRRHAMAVAEARRTAGARNDLLARVAADPAFAAIRGKLGEIADPARFVGRAPEQTAAFFRDEVDPVLARMPAASREADYDVRV
ncbi:MAG: adenylosuccinate lyase [Planctomycetota bacterium]